MSIQQVFSDIRKRAIARRLKRGAVKMLNGQLVEAFTIPNDVYGVPCNVCEFLGHCSGFAREVCLEMTPDDEHQYGLASVLKPKR